MRFLFPKLVYIVLLIFIVSCTTFPGYYPEWISKTPTNKDNEVYMVGGPEPSLKEARSDVLRGFSSMLNTQVSLFLKEFSSLTFDELKREVEEKSEEWVRAKSNSVLIGIREIERYKESSTGNWWVLAKINMDDIKKSIKATSEELVRKKNQISRNSEIVVDFLNSIEKKRNSCTFVELLRLYSDAYKMINQMEFAKELMGEVDGSKQYLMPYIESSFQSLVSQLQLDVDFNSAVLYKNAVEKIKVSNNQPLDLPIGDLVCSIYAGASFRKVHEFHIDTTKEIYAIDVHGKHFPLGESTLIVTPSFESMGISVPEEFSVPKTVVSIKTFPGKIGVEIRAIGNVISIDAEQQVLSLLSEKSENQFILDSSQYPKIKFIIDQKRGSSNKMLKTILTSVNVHYVDADRSFKVFTHSQVQAFGSTFAIASERSLKKVMSEMKQNNEFDAFLEECLL